MEARMDTIIAGRYDGFEAAEKGRERLEACGFPSNPRSACSSISVAGAACVGRST
jgi:hypothetical protein